MKNLIKNMIITILLAYVVFFLLDNMVFVPLMIVILGSIISLGSYQSEGEGKQA